MVAQQPRARAGGLHLHALGRRAAAAGGQRALARDLHHAGAAVAVGAQAVAVAQVRDLHAVALRSLQDGFARMGGDGLAVQLESHAGLRCGRSQHGAHGFTPQCMQTLPRNASRHRTCANPARSMACFICSRLKNCRVLLGR